jgi:hypothetical protein
MKYDMESPLQTTEPLRHSSYQRSSAKALAREIFAADSPESVVATLPAEALYCILRTDGISSSADLIELFSAEQLRSCLDFDLWSEDRLALTPFFEWLELPDSTGELSSLQRVLRSLDLRLLAILISRYISVRIFDESTEAPPEDGFVTPDKGYTWLRVGVNEELVDEDGERLSSHQEFLLQRLLALVFDTSAELFYQILAIPSLATPSQLEEEAFQDREKRMQSLGIPDTDFAAALNTPVSALELAAATPAPAIDHATIEPIAPLLATASLPAPLVEQLIGGEADTTELDAEVTLLINAAIVHFSRDWRDLEQVQEIARFVSGTIRIGVEALTEVGIDPHEGLKTFGCQRFYAAGLHELFSTRQLARRVSRFRATQVELPSTPPESTVSALIAGLEHKPPRVPTTLIEEIERNTVDQSALTENLFSLPEYRSFQSLSELRRVQQLLNSLESGAASA